MISAPYECDATLEVRCGQSPVTLEIFETSEQDASDGGNGDSIRIRHRLLGQTPNRLIIQTHRPMGVRGQARLTMKKFQGINCTSGYRIGETQLQCTLLKQGRFKVFCQVGAGFAEEDHEAPSFRRNVQLWGETVILTLSSRLESAGKRSQHEKPPFWRAEL